MKHLIPAALITALSCVLTASCAGDGRKALEKALSRYREAPSAAAIADIGDAIISMAAIESFGSPHPVESGNALVFRKENKLSVVYPFSRTIEGGEEAVLLSTDPSERTVAVAVAGGLALYTGRNTIATVPCAEGPVRAACRLDNDSVLFLAGTSLFRYSFSSETAAPFLTGAKFPPPFRGDFYRAAIIPLPGRAIVVTGIAGRYAMSIISTSPPSVILANRAVASPRVTVTDRGIRCITGSSGSWTVTEISRDGRGSREIARPGSISDIALFPAGIFYEKEEKIHALMDGSSTVRALPFGWRLAGQAGEALMAEHAGKLHVLDPGKLFTAVGIIEREAPEVFKR